MTTNKYIKNSLKLSVLVLLIIILGCKNKSEASDMTEQNKLQELGKNYNAAWNSQTPEYVASFYTPHGTLIVNKGTPIVGREQITKFVRDFMVAFPDMKLTMDSLVTKNGRTEFHWTFKGTNTGPGGTGNPVNFSGFESWKFSNEGLIQESFGTYDANEYDRQVSGQVDN